MSEKKTYEEMAHIVDQELKKRRAKWRLKALPWMDYDDVSQIIRKHLFEKWHMWDQSKDLEPWINTIITNQIRNILRDKYGNFVRPCLQCPFNQGSDCGSMVDLCGYTKSGKQCGECDMYAKWEKGKKHAYNVKLPVSSEYHSQEMSNKCSEWSITEEMEADFHEKLKKVLTERQSLAYDLMIVQDLPDEEVSKQLGFYSNEDTRKAGYRQLKNLEKIFKEKAKALLENEDILIYARNRHGKR